MSIKKIKKLKFEEQNRMYKELDRIFDEDMDYFEIAYDNGYFDSIKTGDKIDFTQYMIDQRLNQKKNEIDEKNFKTQ